VTAPLTIGQIWGIPIVIGVASMVGLVSALLGNGVWDVLSWVALSWPVAVILRYVAQPAGRGRDSL
jgi:hypothetical protein